VSGGQRNDHGPAGQEEPVHRHGDGGSGTPAAPRRRDAIIREIKHHLAAENAQDLKALLAGMTEDCYNLILCDPCPLYRGPQEVGKRYGTLWTAFPDLQVRLRRVVAIEGEMAVTEHTLSGTHSGSLYGVAPTARFVSVDTAVIWDFDGERVRGETVYFDLATMLRQTGTLTLGASAPLGR